MQWKKFTENHQEAYCFVVPLLARWPSQTKFDKKGQILPPPYQLLREAFQKIVATDWCSKKIQKGGLFKVADDGDARKIIDFFSAEIISSDTPPHCKARYQLNYSDYDYAKLARKIGYEID